MRVVDEAVDPAELISVIMDAITRAGVDSGPGAPVVVSADISLQAVATHGAGGALEFRVPVIGAHLHFGAKREQRLAHTIEVSLVPDGEPRHEVRSGTVEDTLVEALEKIKKLIARAGTGEQPWRLVSGSVEVSFGVTSTGTLSLGVDASHRDETVNTLRLHLASRTDELSARVP